MKNHLSRPNGNSTRILCQFYLQLNKANASDTEAAFLDLNLSIHNDIVSTKIYDTVFNPIMVEGYAALFSCTAVVQASDSMTASM